MEVEGEMKDPSHPKRVFTVVLELQMVSHAAGVVEFEFRAGWQEDVNGVLFGGTVIHHNWYAPEGSLMERRRA